MADTLRADEVEVGYHPDGYRIDKTASLLNYYTKWTVSAEGRWGNPEPVCFHSLPESGWIVCDRFVWDE